MRKTAIQLLQVSILLAFFSGIFLSPMLLQAQDSTEQTTVQDNSSSFNDSVQFDDMEPVFYEAAKEADTPAPAKSEGGSIILYVGIAIVLVVVLIVLKKAGGRKKS